jgi:riboflavin transporter FmnP
MNTAPASSIQRTEHTRKIVLMAVLCAIAYLCVFIFRISIIPAAPFLSYEPKDVILVIGAFLFGPLEGIVMSVCVSLVEMVTISSTGPIGMIMNIISSCAFCGVAGLIYKKKRTMSGAVIGLACGTLMMTVLMVLWNYLITPLYMGTPRDVVADMLLPVFLPFNLLKGILNAAVTLLLYKPISNILKRTGFIVSKNQETANKSKQNLLVGIAAGFVLISCILLILILNDVF